MPEEKKNKEIELYSDDVQEIIGTTPGWILSSGITMILAIIVVLFIGSWVFKYPDIINSDIKVTTENIPANLIAKSTGKITGLFASDSELVDKGKLIAVIENPANTTDIDSLKMYIAEYDSGNWYDKEAFRKISTSQFSLGDVESSYSLFRSKLEEYLRYVSRDESGKKISSINDQLINYRNRVKQLNEQVKLQAQDLSLSVSKFERDSDLYIRKVLAQADFETSKMNLIQKRYSKEVTNSELTNSQIQYNQLRHQVLELGLDRSARDADYDLSLKQLLSNMKAAIAKWEQDYAIISPVKGRLTFSRVWSLNQNVSAGELVVTVVPLDKGNVVGILRLPVTGSGKVKKDMKVNVKFSNYPYMEFGMVIGKIDKISQAPDEKYYLAEVVFPNGLVTNYGKQLSFRGEMTGTAEIITEDLRIIQRIFYPVKSLLKKHL
jgi:multidrug resistance efflux pump